MSGQKKNKQLLGELHFSFAINKQKACKFRQ